jgi:hypothetical protein
MNQILIIFLLFGLYSCRKKKKSEKKTEHIIIKKTVSELKDFELIEDFKKHKAEFSLA